MLTFSETELCLLTLLRRVLGNSAHLPENHSGGFNCKDWNGLLELAAAQGVLAVAKEGLTEREWHMIPAELKIRWQLSVERIESRYHRQKGAYVKLLELFSANGIRVQLLKGIRISEYYPEPSHRECGDIDIFLFDDYDKGNSLIEQQGIKVDRTGFKHSKFRFCGVTVENHKNLLNVALNKYDRTLEPLLRKLARENNNPDFHLLFNIRHMIVHLMSSGLVLRHLADLYLLMKMERERINFEKVTEILKESRQFLMFGHIVHLISECFADKSVLEPLGEFPKDENVLARLYEDTFRNIVEKPQTAQLPAMSVARRKILGAKGILRAKWKYDLIEKGYFFKEFIKRIGYAFKIFRYKIKL